ncbi:helix-turn-helix domain-containing protein [Streptococcus gallolyticus]|uniref:helix-turn-helix domain-containing protein n=1 Tax=Streptococcus gallolyticus TaxID=315405 RepID=UPI00088574F0|nr:helix-turn-helix transcriptional regulator [Streptococcus gallolyticus]SDK14620.1 DNA-binding transcriptional regulator, XRE-family HTH domain [Streptococcus gallolyticus]SDL63812.1 DNA-binding transcriptional regulator, XRE-family HTH domain [Streptococcus gallolyticus]
MTKNRLKDLRKATGKSQKDFYNEIVATELNLGVTLRTYQNWEKPENEIKSKPANSLADYFNVPVSYLLGYDDKLTVGDAMEILEAVASGDISPDDEIAKKINESQNRTIKRSQEIARLAYEKYKDFDLVSNIKVFTLLLENCDSIYTDITRYVSPRLVQNELTEKELKSLDTFISLLEEHGKEFKGTADSFSKRLNADLKNTPTNND